MAAFWWFLLRSMIRSSKRHRITSLADLVAHRYGNSAVLGGLVTVIAVVGIVPYIALQLKAVSDTFAVLHSGAVTVAHESATTPVLQDTALYVALSLAAFTILFGTRHLDASERHEGMVAAIALESCVKLVAFLAGGLYVTFGIFDGVGDLVNRAASNAETAALFTLQPQTSYQSWFWLIVLSMFAILFLPRQFQVAVVENVDERHVNTAIWLFPLYLLAINLFVLPIAIGGLLVFGRGDVNPDTFVLALPIATGQPLIALAVFVGGLSAATGMVIVETIALATMVSNSLVLPSLLWFERRLSRTPVTSGPVAAGAGLPLASFGYGGDLGRLTLRIRRTTIVGVLLLGYAYFRLAGEGPALVAIGLVSFAAVAQFAPAIIGGLLWRGGTRNGALVGLLAGFAAWTYTLLLPTFARSGWLPESFLVEGPWGVGLLRPEQLFGLQGMDDISHGMFWSMLLNAGCYVVVSMIGRDREPRALRHTAGRYRAHRPGRRAPRPEPGLRGRAPDPVAALPRHGGGQGRPGGLPARPGEPQLTAGHEPGRRRGAGATGGGPALRSRGHHVGAGHGGLGGQRERTAVRRRGDGHPRRGLPGPCLQPRAGAQVTGAGAGHGRTA